MMICLLLHDSKNYQVLIIFDDSEYGIYFFEVLFINFLKLTTYLTHAETSGFALTPRTTDEISQKLPK